MMLIQNCTSMRQLKQIHALFVTHGIHQNNYAMSKLVSFSALSSCGNLSYASLIFEKIQAPNCFIYNTLIRAYSRGSRPEVALNYFDKMLKKDHIKPDNHTFHFVLLACVNACWVDFGRQIHNWVFKNGVFLSDNHVQTAVVRLYCECKNLSEARKLFEEIPCLDVIQWNVLMNGYLKANLESRALGFFHEMLVSGFEPDEFCLTTALTACAQLGALWQGKWIHEYTKKRGELKPDVFVGTALIDMYAKCGCIDMAVEVFEGMHKRNAFSWAAIVGGFAVHGYARRAIHCLERMQVDDGVIPDGVVLLGVLTACTHAGLLKEGQFLFDNMESLYGIKPRHEHYSCVVDLLCRAGQGDEALKIIRRMPMKPLASVWGALLTSCRVHNNVDLAELAVKELLQLDSGNGLEEEGAYVQLSNIYFSAQRSEDARKIRRIIVDRGIKKTPGCSLIEVDGMINEFVSGDVSHPDRAQIHEILELLSVDLV